MTWENARTPEEKVEVRTAAARARLNGILAAMKTNTTLDGTTIKIIETRYLIFTGRSTGPKTLWRSFTKTELAMQLENDDKLIAFAGLFGTCDVTLIPADGVIEGYL
jgi:hypothetical protein